MFCVAFHQTSNQHAVYAYAWRHIWDFCCKLTKKWLLVHRKSLLVIMNRTAFQISHELLIEPLLLSPLHHLHPHHYSMAPYHPQRPYCSFSHSVGGLAASQPPLRGHSVWGAWWFCKWEARKGLAGLPGSVMDGGKAADSIYMRTEAGERLNRGAFNLLVIEKA